MATVRLIHTIASLPGSFWSAGQLLATGHSLSPKLHLYIGGSRDLTDLIWPCSQRLIHLFSGSFLVFSTCVQKLELLYILLHSELNTLTACMLLTCFGLTGLLTGCVSLAGLLDVSQWLPHWICLTGWLSKSVLLAHWIWHTGWLTGSALLSHWIWHTGIGSLDLTYVIWLTGAGSFDLAHYRWLTGSGPLPLACLVWLTGRPISICSFYLAH